jgi:hypothetical protein
LCGGDDADGDTAIGSPPINPPSTVQVSGPASTSTSGSSTIQGAASGLPIPVLNSLPGAHATLYLNFAGDTVPSFLSWSNIVIPSFSTVSDGSPLTQADVNAITGIWQIAAENYAPFNIQRAEKRLETRGKAEVP